MAQLKDTKIQGNLTVEGIISLVSDNGETQIMGRVLA